MLGLVGMNGIPKSSQMVFWHDFYLEGYFWEEFLGCLLNVNPSFLQSSNDLPFKEVKFGKNMTIKMRFLGFSN